ncbi:hypothetical protein ACFU53_23950 [Streptomyces sp. NPDC057474]|uniref:hypothetical protein n=1 Tax=Streptomyces sp. NPDC057474 TaxID=3346144 RepID=UPI00369957BB
MKKTTGDLWPESRSTTNGIEPTEAQGESVGGIGYSVPTSRVFGEVGTVKWVTDRQATWSTYPEIRE